jgi:hypothetical protein
MSPDRSVTPSFDSGADRVLEGIEGSEVVIVFAAKSSCTLAAVSSRRRVTGLSC